MERSLAKYHTRLRTQQTLYRTAWELSLSNLETQNLYSVESKDSFYKRTWGLFQSKKLRQGLKKSSTVCLKLHMYRLDKPPIYRSFIRKVMCTRANHCFQLQQEPLKSERVSPVTLKKPNLFCLFMKDGCRDPGAEQELRETVLAADGGGKKGSCLL